MLKTAGGRVFSATALGETLEEAFKAACEGVKLVKFDGMHYRKGIASKPRAGRPRVQDASVCNVS
ncbi:hypothetical protein PG987_012102 [Apiospora arundinis]